MALNRQREGAAIVLVGQFNPSIIQPSWLARGGLIQNTEADGARIAGIGPEVSDFVVKWVHLQTLLNRFMATTDTADNLPLVRDLVVGIFQYLEHTPITQVGINRHVSYSFTTEDRWHHVGHVLAPKKIWKHHLTDPGLLAIGMQGKRRDDRRGNINVQVNSAPGQPQVIEVSVNDHIELDPPNQTGRGAANLIQEKWEVSMNDAVTIADGLMTEILDTPL